MSPLPNAWMIRAGKDGQREHAALTSGCAIAGWEEVGDLSSVTDRAALRATLTATYPRASAALIANWAGQLLRFTSVIATGDYVVMPLKTRPGMLAIGLVVGPYWYDHDAEPDVRHKRPVDWEEPIPRETLKGDLLNSLGALQTVCQLERHDAARRIAQVANGDPDPGWHPEAATVSDLEDREAFITRALDEDILEPLRISVRQILTLWGATRRTDRVLETIAADLVEHGLATQPPLAHGWLDNVVEVLPIETTPEFQNEPDNDLPNTPTQQPVSVDIGTLEAATGGVISVRQSDSLVKAVTLMVRHDYSQVAVVDSNDYLIGAVSWESIGRAGLSKAQPSLADATFAARTVYTSDDLLSVVPEVSAHDFVFVRDQISPKLRGIVTVADTSAQFETMARPFALIEEAERRLRRRTDETFPVDRLRDVANKPNIDGASDLSLGAYKHVLAEEKDFALLGWSLDHELFIEMIDGLRSIRNELMHFSTDPLGTSDLELLRAVVSTLQTVDPRP